jgi:hypothetical protein
MLAFAVPMITQLTDSELEELKSLDRLRQKDSRKKMRLQYLSIKKSALSFRYGENDLPRAFYDFIEDHGIQRKSSILLWAADWEQGINPLFGEILSQDERFYKFDFDFSKRGDSIIECSEWEDITDNKNLNVNNKGIPKTHDRIALEVLRELNSEQSLPADARTSRG